MELGEIESALVDLPEISTAVLLGKSPLTTYGSLTGQVLVTPQLRRHLPTDPDCRG